MTFLRTLDISGMVTTLLTIYFCGRKHYIGWVFNIIVCIIYGIIGIIGIINNLPFMTCLNVVCLILAIYYLIKWIKDDKNKRTIMSVEIPKILKLRRGKNK